MDNLSENQKKFVRAAKKAGLEVYSYSGRFMYGKKCPAVTVDGPGSFGTKAKVCWDNMAFQYVVYAPY
jgi:hypothetical protein